MAKAIPEIRKVGRPATGVGTPVLVRMSPDQLARLDAWAATQPDAPGRPEAVRRLLDQALPR